MLMFGSAADQTKPAAPAEVSDAKQNKCSFKLLNAVWERRRDDICEMEPV